MYISLYNFFFQITDKPIPTSECSNYNKLNDGSFLIFTYLQKSLKKILMTFKFTLLRITCFTPCEENNSNSNMNIPLERKKEQRRKKIQKDE